jgi:hypothetical protein
MRKKTTGIFLLLLMLFSTLVYYFYYFLAIPSLPKENIVKNLSKEEERMIIQNGYTLVNFYVSEKCADCEELELFLKDLVRTREFNRVFLNLKDSNVSYSVAMLWSLRGSKRLENFTKEEVKREICNLMINPPAECFL